MRRALLSNVTLLSRRPAAALLAAAAAGRRLDVARFCGSRAASDVSIDIDKRMTEVNAQFGEARELIADAKESIGTTDYSDDAEDAIQATKAALELYTKLLGDLRAAGREDDRTALDRENGQKMKQLDLELRTVLDHDDH